MEIKIGHWFGHYDSRGGSTLVIGARTEDEAVFYHLKRSYCMEQEENEELWSDVFRCTREDDFFRTIIVRFFDGSDWDGKDLIYDDKVTGWALCKEKEVECYETLDGEWHEEIPNGSYGVEEIWIANAKPEAPAGYKLASLDQFGEDAFGLQVHIM
jgi:hypothetical protein